MAANANITGFSVGQDLQSLLLIPNAGGPTINSTQMGRLIEFKANPVITPLSVTPVNNGGIQLVRNIYHGWNGEMSFTRFNGNLTIIMGAAMANFNLNGLETYYTIMATVVNSIYGTVDTYSFQNAVIESVDTGDFTGLKQVDQKFAFRAQQMLINGGANATVALT